MWKSVQDDLQIELSPGNFTAFISQSQLEALTEADGKLVASVTVYSPWHQRMIEARLQTQIREAFERVTGKPCELRLTTRGGAVAAISTASLGPLFAQADTDRVSYHQAAQKARLRPDFTFEQFAVSSTNEMAYAAAQAVSRNPGQAYHLLFLFGGVGVGKTHLMQGIGHRILETDPATKVIYCTGEEFTNEIIEAIQFKTTAEFRKKYRHVKLLLIDDIQFIGGKDKVQEEFFHTFNAIHQEGGQIVLTSDKMPRDIGGLEDRMRSRFEGGLTIDIQQPSFELRTAILLIKAKTLSLNVEMDVAQLIAANIDSTRALEGFLRRLMAEIEATGGPVTTEMAKRILSASNAQAQPIVETASPYSPAKIVAAVAGVFSVKHSQLVGKRRKKELVTPRHLAIYLIRTECRTPLVEIGELFGGRDHSTILHAVDKVTKNLAEDDRLRGSLALVKQKLT